MNKMKKMGIVSIIIFLLFSIVCISWYAYLKMFGAERVVATTFEVGLQTTVDGNTKYFMEVNSFDDCYEIKFNYMLDETQTSFYSHGVQYYTKPGRTPEWSFSYMDEGKKYLYSEGMLWWKDDYYKIYLSTQFDVGCGKQYEYASGDDWATAHMSTNPITPHTTFRIQLDDKLYLMKFKGTSHNFDEKAYYGGAGDRLYLSYNYEYLAERLYYGIKSLPYGTNQAVVFEFGDLFNYYEHIGDNVYSSEPLTDTEKLVHNIKSYYSIKVTKHEGKIQKASQSLFNCVAGKFNFNLTTSDSEDYFFGRTTITVDNIPEQSEVSYVKINDTQVACKLSDKFNNAYLTYADKINLIVLIDLDVLESEGLEFVGFTKDSGLNNYKVISCQTVENIDGELVYSGVTYD